MGKIAEDGSAVLQNLIDAGCSAALAEHFFELQALGKHREQLDLLSTHRRLLLDDIHKAQKHLDCLDYLLYRMKKDNYGIKKG